MSRFHILHVNEDRDLRDIVTRSLARDPAISVACCTRADEAVNRATEPPPDLILCGTAVADGGDALLAHLAQASQTARIPVVVMTDSRQPCEIERLKSLGAAGVIVTPINPATLVDSVRRHLRFSKLANLRDTFVQRLRRDAAQLAQLRDVLAQGAPPGALAELETCAHKLAGTAGIFEFGEISHAASALEDAVVARRRGAPGGDTVETDLDALIRCIEEEFSGQC